MVTTQDDVSLPEMYFNIKKKSQLQTTVSTIPILPICFRTAKDRQEKQGNFTPLRYFPKALLPTLHTPSTHLLSLICNSQMQLNSSVTTVEYI